MDISSKPRSTLSTLLSIAGISFALGGIVVYVLVVFALGLGQPAPSRSNPVNRGPKPFPAGDQAAENPGQSVVALGRLEPQGGVISIGVTIGDRLERLLVKEGDPVHENQDLAYLESHAVRQADRDLAASQVQEATLRLAAVTVSGQAAIREAELRLEQVRKVEPLDIRAQEAKVRLLEEQLANATVDLKRFQALKLNSVTQQQLELQELAASKAKEELAAAVAILAKLKAGHDTNLLAAQAQLETAKANLVRFQAEIPVESLKKTLALAEARLKHSIIHAPTSGIILKIISYPGETLGARPILQMGDTKHMQVIAEVYETEIKNVHEKDKATITSPALPSSLTGEVVYVGSMIAKNRYFDLDPTAAADHRVVEVKIRLDSSDVAANFINLQVKVSLTKRE